MNIKGKNLRKCNWILIPMPLAVMVALHGDVKIQKDLDQTILDKITHAYSFGTAQNALKSINRALDLNIKEYVTVNFDSLVDAIDAIGGVTITVTNEELKYINP